MPKKPRLRFLQLGCNTGQTERPKTHFHQLHHFQIRPIQVLTGEPKRAIRWCKAWFGPERGTAHAVLFPRAGCGATAGRNQLGTRGSTNLVRHRGRGTEPPNRDGNEAIAWETGRGIRKGIPLDLLLLRIQCSPRRRTTWVSKSSVLRMLAEGTKKQKFRLSQITSADRLRVSIGYRGGRYLLAFHIHNEN